MIPVNIKILLLLAWRNLFTQKGKNFIVGSIMMFGTFLLVLGTSILDSIENSMTKSIINSLAGHLQVYDADAKDELALFGGGFMGAPDIGKIPNYAYVQEQLLSHPNVKAVVPMGIDFAGVFSGNIIDRSIEELRKAVSDKNQEAIQNKIEKLTDLIQMLKEESIKRKEVLSNQEQLNTVIKDLSGTQQEGFWDDIATHPEKIFQYLDTKVAPHSEEGEGTFIRYVGTDLEKFRKYFDRFEIVEGTMVPAGQRGFLFNHQQYEEVIKNRVAAGLDYIWREVNEKQKSIAHDAMLQSKVKQLAKQYRRITFSLEAQDSNILIPQLQQFLNVSDKKIENLMQQFLTVDDNTIADRYDFFYKKIAPHIKLYLFDIGEHMTIRAFTRSGYMKSINIKIYGTFKFKGMEKSALAGSHCLMDINSFRDLYGLMSKDKLAELNDIKKEIGVEIVARGNAEDELFGGNTSLVKVKEVANGFDEFENLDIESIRKQREDLVTATFDQDSINNGMALNAAIILKDASLLKQTQADIQKMITDKKMGLQVVDWKKASGMVGQFATLVRGVLYVTLFIIFLVALIIINNSMIMATMERVIEVGTMRAIGAQRKQVLLLFLLETIILGLLAGSLGAILGAGLIHWLGITGVPAFSDELIFLFSGQYLYPSVTWSNIIFAMIVIFIVSFGATFYPAFIATRIQPVVAMQARE